MRVLGIESSCDETGVAVFDQALGLLGHAVYSQVELHAEYGGVVPELASRDHIRKTTPLIRQVLAEARTTPEQISGVAYTAGPGLIGALLVGPDDQEIWASFHLLERIINKVRLYINFLRSYSHFLNYLCVGEASPTPARAYLDDYLRRSLEDSDVWKR